jgi:hypothetical protein
MNFILLLLTLPATFQFATAIKCCFSAPACGRIAEERYYAREVHVPNTLRTRDIVFEREADIPVAGES